MPRVARLVIPGLPHHVTQRGNRRQQTFFCDEDYSAYIELMAQWCRERGVAIWAYCLMPNHVHLLGLHGQCARAQPGFSPRKATSRSLAMREPIIAVPRSEDALARAIGEAHRRYTRRINFREKWRGYLWQGRFASFVMDEPHLLAAARYVELNPVRAGLVTDASQWRFISARAHLTGRDDALVQVAPLPAMIADWRAFLRSAMPEDH